MANVLYLTHRLPYPPDKGDKITTFNFLRHLAAKHRVYLGTFVDSEADRQHYDALRALCAEVKLVEIDPRWRRVWSAQALLRGESISQTYHRSAALQTWVNETIAARGIDTTLAYCSAMAPYLAHPRFAALRKVTHYADVDSEKWRVYAAKHRGAMAWVYGREARTLLALERAMSAAYDITSFVSDADAALYRQLAPESAARVRVIPNGVDTVYFDPRGEFADPFPPAARAIVFTGAMDYWPNVDAVTWFAAEVLPRVRQALPAAQFWIVGSNPARAVTDLGASSPGVVVTGRVPDVRPYIRHAAAVVAPLRVARGTQNKVLEAFAMARPVVLSSAAAAGLLQAPFIDAWVHDEPEHMAQAVARLMSEPPGCEVAREYVMQQYSWQHSLSLLDDALQLPRAQ